MRCIALACAVLVGVVSISRAHQPSQSVLADMGLGDMVVMSDSEALSVRGMGYSSVKAYGKSWASVSIHGASAGAENGYFSSGKKAAWGETDSHAGVVIKKGGGHGGHGGDDHGSSGGGGSYGGGGSHGGKGGSIKVVAFSGGSSKAGRK